MKKKIFIGLTLIMIFLIIIQMLIMKKFFDHKIKSITGEIIDLKILKIK